MFKQKIFIVSFFVLALIAVLNYVGIKLSLYWVYRWYDIPMHMLGGLCVTLFSLSLYSHLNRVFPIIVYKINVFYVLFFTLLVVTISWEVFELLGQITFVGDRGYWPDTLDDILNAYMGEKREQILGDFFEKLRHNAEITIVRLP